ncbi:MAG: hypothetical protein KDD03_13285 [Gelidibacter sp.]|nr:hypothetical protein [Gelidibacter sp.]
MTILIGKIEAIEDKSFNKKVKNLLTLKSIDNQTAFIEFRGVLKNVIEKFRVGDQIEVALSFDGKKSNSGTHYNNLVAKSVHKI